MLTPRHRSRTARRPRESRLPLPAPSKRSKKTPKELRIITRISKSLSSSHRKKSRRQPRRFWLLCGREVVALTEATAAIQSSTGAITIYRRHNKPALGPVGDSLDDLASPGALSVRGALAAMTDKQTY